MINKIIPVVVLMFVALTGASSSIARENVEVVGLLQSIHLQRLLLSAMAAPVASLHQRLSLQALVAV